MTAGFWCELALVAGSVRESVRITVDHGRFDSVEPDAAPRAEDRRLRGITIPGLANAHSHAFHRALRSRTQQGGGTFWTWRELMYRAAERLEPDGYHRLARAAFAEMVLAGVTTVGEFHYVHHRADGAPYADPNAMGRAVLAAAKDAGLRITLLDTLYLHGGLDDSGPTPLAGVQRRFGDVGAEAWVERVDDLARTVGRSTETHRIGAAIHSVRAVDPVSMRAVADWAAAADAPLHAHVSEQIAENEQCLTAYGATPTAVLQRAGVLDRRFTAVHATHVTVDDMALLAGSTVCVCPTTERDLGDGIGPTGAMVAAGSTLSLGTDSHATVDLFEEARALELDERLRTMRRGCHPVDRLLAAATVDGHHCLGWDDVGAIAVGARADLVAVRLDSVRTAGVGPAAAAEAVVFAATTSDVTDVVIDGRVTVIEGEHVDLDVAHDLGAAIDALMED